MDYTTIIKDLARCDGKNGTCKTCTYKEHPACREAMAREAAAVLNLQGVRLKISTEMTGKVLVERNQALKMVEAYIAHKEGVDELIARLFGDLCEMRHCATCRYNGKEDAAEICADCMMEADGDMPAPGSQWEPADRYTTIDKPGETEAQPPVEDVTEVSGGE
jgi:hypothetical protein